MGLAAGTARKEAGTGFEGRLRLLALESVLEVAGPGARIWVRRKSIANGDAQIFARRFDRNIHDSVLVCVARSETRLPLAGATAVLQNQGVRCPGTLALRALTDRLDIISGAGAADAQHNERVCVADR